MPFDVSGNFTRLYNWQTDRTNGIKILASRMDAEFDNYATGMNLVFFRDGRVAMAGDLKMGLNRITGIADGSAASPSIKFNGDVNTGAYLAGVSQYGITVNSTQRGLWTAAGLDVTGNITATGTMTPTGGFTTVAVAPGGNANGIISISPSGTGVYSNLQMKGVGGSLAQGMDVLAGGAAAFFSSDAFTFRNAAQSTTYVTINSSGVLQASGISATGAGTPLTVNSTNSSAFKTIYQDAGVTKGTLLSDAVYSFRWRVPGGTDALTVTASGNDVAVAGNLSIGGAFNYGPTSGAAADTTASMNNTNSLNQFKFQSWSAGVPQVDGSIFSLRGTGLLLDGLSHVQLRPNGSTVLDANTGGIDVTGQISASTKFVLSTNLATPTPTNQGLISYSSTNGLTLTGQGSSYDVSLFNRLGSQKLRINSGGELELLGAPFAPTPGAGNNSTQIATTAFVVTSFAPLASPTFTGTPAAPTAAVGTSTTQLATTAFVQGEKNAAVQSVVSAGTVTPTFTNDGVKITALAVPCQLLNWTGTASEMWGLVVRIKDNGTARALTYDTKYRAIGTALPTTTVVGKTLYLNFVYNLTDDKFDLVGTAQE